MVYRPTARVLTVLELLQANGQMSGRELAARLEVDVRTIRRYITTLQDMGIPIDSELGREGGYALRAGFRLPPLMFNDEEVMVLALGLRLAGESALRGAGGAVESAMAKIERVLPDGLRARLKAMGDLMGLDEEVHPFSDAEVPIVEGYVAATLTVAARTNVQARISYVSKGECTERVIDPYGVVVYQGRWYTVAYCHLRGGLRVFRLDRVEGVRLTESSFEPPPETFDPLAYLLNSFESIPDEWQIEVLLDMPLADARRNIPREMATLQQDANSPTRVRLQASLTDLRLIARVLMGLGCPVEVLHPSELRRELALLAAQFVQPNGIP
ncbi:MAG: YafY family protein [Anaerolineae bacterium]